jgi:hypothetical protein
MPVQNQHVGFRQHFIHALCSRVGISARRKHARACVSQRWTGMLAKDPDLPSGISCRF